MRQLLDVVNQAVELPLPVHLGPSAQREAVQLLVVPGVAEDRFHRREAPGDHPLAQVAVDLRPHPVGVALKAGRLAEEEGHLAGGGRRRGAQALLA